MNDLVHYAAGVAIASALGYAGWRRWGLGLFAIAPDWDVFVQPLLPSLLDALDAGRGARHGVALVLAHGSFSHSVPGLALLVALAWACRVRGRALATATLAALSHLPLDLVLTWSVWPFVPFSDVGFAWGLLGPEDIVVTSVAIGIGLAAIAWDVHAWMRRRRNRPAAGISTRALGVGSLVLLAVVVALPGGFERIILEKHARDETAVVDPVSYTRYVLLETPEDGSDTMRLVVADARGRAIAEETLPRTQDLTGGAPNAAAALQLVRDALVDGPAPSPLVRPLLTARLDDAGRLLVEAREASTIAAERHLGERASGLDFEIDDAGRVAKIHAVDQGERLAEIPLETLPLWVPIADAP